MIVYSVSVPTKKMYVDLEIQGFLLPSSIAKRDVRPGVGDRYLVKLLSGQVKSLKAQGVDLELPTRRSFTDELWEETTSDPNCTITLSEKMRVEAFPDEPLEVGYNFPPPRTFKSTSDTFCHYDPNISSDQCPLGMSIHEQLIALNQEHPSTYFQLAKIGEGQVEVGNTGRKRPIYAVRIGKITDKNDDPSPALYYIATQHAQEWMAAEAAMRMIRYFAGAIKNNPGGDIASLLKDKTLVVVPVANPDGYQHSHDDYPDNRGWRKNRRDNTDVGCPSNPGVDPNRNYPLGWGQGHSSGVCSNSKYRGPSAFSESETKALKRLVLNELEPQYGPHGSYKPLVALDVHTYGNMVLFHPGMGENGDGKECRAGDNCLTPDFQLLRSIFGSEDPDSAINWDPDPFQDPWWGGIRWPVGIGDRIIYPVGGGLKGELMMGDFPEGMTKPISVTLELSWWPENQYPFHAEQFYIGESYWGPLATNQIELAKYLLELLPDIENGAYVTSEVGHYSIPAIERRCFGQYDNDFHETGECWEDYSPALYAAALKNLTNVNIFPPSGYDGTSSNDVVGHTYNLYQWRPNIPFVFPPEAVICSREEGCETIVLDDGQKDVNLCSPDLFPDGNGSTFEDPPWCGWVLHGGPGSYIARKKVNLTTMRDARLFYSYQRSDYKIVEVKIQSKNKSRTVRRHPRTYEGLYRNSSRRYFNTEVVDAMDFDGEEDVTVIFEVIKDGSNCDPFLVGDVVFVGWKK